VSGRDCLAIDWDGVIHEHAEWRPAFGRLDFSLIRAAHSAGYAVAIMTCNDIGRVAEALRAAGFAVYPDHRMAYRDWSGGPDGPRKWPEGRGDGILPR